MHRIYKDIDIEVMLKMNSVANTINFCLYRLNSKKVDRSARKQVNNKLQSCLRSLKHMQSNDDFEKTYEMLWTNKYFRNLCLTKNLFPTELNDMASYAELDFFGDINCELRWQLKLFEKNQSSLILFIQMKHVFDELIIDGKYPDAAKLIDEIENNFGVSLWTIENRIMLQYKNGKTSNKEMLEKFGKGFFSIIVYFFDMKSRGDIEAEQYEYLTNREISQLLRVYPEEKDILDFYHYMVAPFSFEMNTTSISNVLSFAIRLPLIDRYLCVIDILEHYLATGYDTIFRNYLYSYLHKLRVLKDDSFDALSFTISSPEDRLNDFVINEDTGDLKDLFVTGKTEECYVNIKNYIETQNIDINIYNLYIETCLLLNSPVDNISVSDEKKLVLKCLKEIYTVSQEYRHSVETIKKLCYGSLHSRWGRDIYNNLSKFICPIGHSMREVSIKYSNLQKLTVETVCENLAVEEAVHFLKSGRINTGSNYLQFLINVLENQIDIAVSICGIDSVNGLLKISNSRHYEDYENLLKKPITELDRIRISKILWNKMDDNRNIEKGIDYFLHLFFKREEYALIAPIKEFISYFSSGNDVDTANIRVPILYYILSAFFDQSARDDLTIACEDFFDYNDIKKPSRMLEESPSYSKEELVYFLRHICIPQIMGPVLLDIRSTRDLDEERINICQYLRNLDPSNAEIYDEEIKDTTHKLFINDRVSSIESHKVQVNIEGIKSRINKDMKSIFYKYMYSRNTEINALWDYLSKLEGFENTSIITWNYPKIFDELVTTIRNEFVEGEEYGLDTYLSLNIRHGMLAALLRAPLTKINLYTEKDIITEQYNIDPRWLYCINDKKDKSHIREAIIKFNEKTDSIIDLLKNQLIQVSTEEKPSRGIFDYTFSETDKRFLESYVRPDTTFEDFVDMYFEVLWKKTDENLDKMKTIIREDIKQQYNSAFNELIEAYNHLKKPFPDAKKWLRESQNEMDAMLENLCGWFERSDDALFADFEIRDAFHVGLKTIQNIHPEIHFEVRIEHIDSTGQISGKYWKHYTTIFQTLLENISEHAKEIDGVKYIDCFLTRNESLVYIKMQNDFDCTMDYESAVRRIENANSLTKDDTYLARINEEGGTGIPKIFKIFKADLHMNVIINCSLNPENETFAIEITGDPI